MIIGLSEQAMGIERHISLRLGGFGLVDRPVVAPAAGPRKRPNAAGPDTPKLIHRALQN
jgi:hypothetical protein